jgi:hypothetical protein
VGSGLSPRPSGGTWFLVLGSYPHGESGKAEARLGFVQGHGISASIVDTDNYPGFRSGYLSVVVGPYSKAEARRVMLAMKSVVPDAYLRSGW